MKNVGRPSNVSVIVFSTTAGMTMKYWASDVAVIVASDFTLFIGKTSDVTVITFSVNTVISIVWYQL